MQTGEVVVVYQTHFLEVTLELENGSIIETIERSIDTIFHEITNCGEPCVRIILATD